MIRFSFLFTLCFLLLTGLSYAQGNLTGRVYENKTHVPIAGITIKNLKSNFTTLSDQKGGFSIRAHIGDLITFSGFSYQPDTLYVKDLNYTEILLDLHQNMLKEVQVTTPDTKLGNLTAPPTLAPFGGQTLVYQTDDAGNYTGGVSLRLFDSHKAAKKKKKDAQIAKDDEINQQIAKTFSAENLQNYLPIRGQELDNFRILYLPDIDLFTDKSFNLTVYLNICYKSFLQIPAEKRQSKEFLSLNNKSN